MMKGNAIFLGIVLLALGIMWKGTLGAIGALVILLIIALVIPRLFKPKGQINKKDQKLDEKKEIE